MCELTEKDFKDTDNELFNSWAKESNAENEKLVQREKIAKIEYQRALIENDTESIKYWYNQINQYKTLVAYQ